MRAGLAGAIAILVLMGCATTKVSVPEFPSDQAGITAFVCGRLEYSGSNSDWLPLSLRDMPDDPSRVLRYRYEVRYGVDDENAFDLFNPFLLFGATKSKDTLFVLAELVVGSDGEELRVYREIVRLDKSKSLFSEGETLTAMRRTGLLRVRDLVDSRLARDHAELRSWGMICET